MANYTPGVDFAAKDDLTTGDPNKVVKGSELSSEFSSVQTAVNSKADSASPTLTGTGTAVNLTVSGTLNATGTLQVGSVAITATAAELNLLDGVTATTAEINYLDGVTSNIQTQLNTKAPSSNPIFTGSFTSPGIDDNANSTAITIDTNENIGIGTTTPGTRLDARTTASSPSDAGAVGQFIAVQSAGIDNILTVASSGNGGAGRGAALVFNAGGSTNAVSVGRIVGLHEALASTPTAPALSFQYATGASTFTEAMRINSNGSIVKGGASGPLWASGTSSPEGVVTAPVGSFYSRTDGGTGTSFYVKESGTGNTGWVAK